jgi:membrane protease YdiL (CAAX protease family)
MSERVRGVWGVFAGMALAGILFSLLFGGVVFEFWWQLAATVGVLVAFAWRSDGESLARLLRCSPGMLVVNLALGIAAAAALYGVFALGRIAAVAILPRGQEEILAVYALRDNVAAWRAGILLAGVIGPGEEIFWRGMVQRRLTDAYGWRGVVLSVLAYGAVHIASGNPTLILAALTCGTFWAVMMMAFRSLWANMISHALWCVAIFVVWPMM